MSVWLLWVVLPALVAWLWLRTQSLEKKLRVFELRVEAAIDAARAERLSAEARIASATDAPSPASTPRPAVAARDVFVSENLRRDSLGAPQRFAGESKREAPASIVESFPETPVRPDARGASVPPPEASEAKPAPETAAPPQAAPAPEAPPPKTAAPAEPPPKKAAARAAFEERLASQWMVWLGGVALAIGAVFLVGYVIELGLLRPWMRIASGLAFGAALVGLGEWTLRRPDIRVRGIAAPSYVPAALTSAGLIAAFASVYLGYFLYGMFGATLTFLMLALLAVGAVALALRQGPLVAALGVLGGYVTPALASTGEPNPIGLFAYLAALSAAALAVGRRRPWPWLPAFALAGDLAWIGLWAWAPPRMGDVPALAIFFAFVAGAFARARPARPDDGRALFALAPVDWIPLLAQVGAMVAAGAYAVYFDYHASLVALFVALAGFASLVGRVGGPPLAALTGAALSLGFVALWDFDRGDDFGLRLTAAALAAVFAVGGFLALRRASGRVLLWAGLSAAMPPLLLAAAYLRLHPPSPAFPTELPTSALLGWVATALAVGAVNLAGAVWAFRRRGDEGREAALGLYAVGAFAGLALAIAIGLQQAWLTVGLALILPAMGYADARLGVPALRRAATTLASVVLVRLVGNPMLLDYPIGGTPVFNWLLYGYGLPAVAFFLASRFFRRRGDDSATSVLDAGGLVFSVLLANLEIRHWANGGRLDALGYEPLEQALQTLTWGGAALGLYRSDALQERLVFRWGTRLLAGLAAGHAILLQGLLFNPLFAGDPVGDWPLFNQSLLSFGAPAVLAFAMRRVARRRGDAPVARLAGWFCGLFGFAYAALEIRRFFHGPRLDRGGFEMAEAYLDAIVAGLAALIAALLAAPRRGGRGLSPDVHGAGMIAALFGGWILLVFANPLFTGDPVGSWPVVNLLALGFAVPAAIAFAFRAVAARRDDADAAAAAGWLSSALVGAYAALEIRRSFHGPVLTGPLLTAEAFSYAAAAGAIAVALAAARRRGVGRLSPFAPLVAGAAALGLIVLLNLLFKNPLFTGDWVGPWPIFNLLALGYAVPAALAELYRRLLPQDAPTAARRVSGASALVLAFLYVSFEARRAFQGGDLVGPVGEGEWYAYSLVWLLFALALLVGGVRGGATILRHAALALLAAVTLKVFLWDMSALEGILRALSFMGLGGALIGIGYLYQRLVFPPQAASADTAPPA